MAPRLKVFVTSDGLTDYVVAVSSRAKALAAWGVRQDVFKEGQAQETDDPALVKAALAQPGEVLRRPSGTEVSLARLKPAQGGQATGPSKAQLKKVADLEARLAALARRTNAPGGAGEGARRARSPAGGADARPRSPSANAWRPGSGPRDGRQGDHQRIVVGAQAGASPHPDGGPSGPA